MSGNTITLEIYASAADNTPDDIEIATGTWVDLIFRQRAGLTAPAEAGDYAVSVAEETNDEAVTVSPSLSVDPTKGGSATEITVSGKAFANGTGSLSSEKLVNPDQNNDGIIDTLIEGDDIPTDSVSGGWGLNTDADADDVPEFDLYLVAAVEAAPNEDPPVPAADAYYAAVPAGDDAVLDEDNTGYNVEDLGYKITLAPAPVDPATTPVVDTPTMPEARYTGNEGLKDVSVSDGAFSTTILAEDLEFGGSQNMSYVRFVDANGDDARARFQVTGTMTLGSDSVGKGKILKISLADWIIAVPDEVKIGGESVAMAVDDADTDDENESTWYDSKGKKVATAPSMTMLDADPAGALDIYVKVSGAVGLGTKTVVLFSGSDALAGARASVEITAVDLNVSPSTALVGREVTVTGSGFTGDVVEIKVGDAEICATVATCKIEVASGGRVVAAFDIPNEAVLKDADDYTITITDSGGRIGNGTVTIPEPTLTVDPPESRIGSTINLSGTGWPTGTGANLVGLYYDGAQYASAITDSSGEWSASIEVPHEVGVGSTHDVEAKATVGDDGDDNVTQKVEHSTPDAVVTLSSAKAQRGTNITVSGENFNVFETVMIEIGESNVTPAGTTTDGIGSFSTEVVVPGLALGNKNLKVTVNNVPVVEFLEVVATPVSTTMYAADVFEPLATAGVLTVVWHFDNDTKAWSFYDPRPEVAAAVDLTMVSSGDNVWIQVTADMDFQGETLTTGWNNITLD